MIKNKIWLLILLFGIFSGGIASAEKQVFEYTGADQTFAVPEGVNQITVKAWGAGGGGTIVQGGNQRGGAAGYAEGLLTVNPGDDLKIVVGEGGKSGSRVTTYGGGGAGGDNPVNVQFYGSSGGGLSGVFNGAVIQDSALLVAAGGGGTPGGTFPHVYGGAGGGETGLDGRVSFGDPAFGLGGSQTGGGAGGPSQGNPGFDGDALTGGDGGDGNGDGAGGGGGGGGGYFGGGGGAGHDRVVCYDCNLDASAGGGAGFCAAEAENCVLTPGDNGGDNENDTLPGNAGDADYVNGVGQGNYAADGGNGLIVIEWEAGEASTEIDITVNDEGTEVIEITCTEDCEHDFDGDLSRLCVNLVCNADSPEVITATLNFASETITKEKQCDKVPPTCTATFWGPDEWHNADDFSAVPPLECELESYSDGVGEILNLGNVNEVFEYTGADQVFTVPAGVTEIRVKAWGGGGGSDANRTMISGGPGGYSEAVLPVTPGDDLRVMVGQGGQYGTTQSYGFGVGIVTVGGAPGGGLSGVFTDGTAPITADDSARALLVAGGGGGHDWNFCDTDAGVDSAFRVYPESPGNSQAGGGATNMSGVTGGCGSGLNNGGGGYEGGTGFHDAVHNQRISHGGTGFAHADATEVQILSSPALPLDTANHYPLPPMTDAADYVTDVGRGGITVEAGADRDGAVNGGHGLVVIEWEAVAVEADGDESVNVNGVSDTCVSTKISDTEVKTVCEYTGVDQQITTPDGATSAQVKVWGAGGGGDDLFSTTVQGGAGGYTFGELDANPGDSFLVVVGEGGVPSSSLPTYGGGGGSADGVYIGSSGGGLSGIFTNAFTQEDAIVIAGGGGGVPGGEPNTRGGGGGGLVGGAGSGGQPPIPSTSFEHGGGGTQTAGGEGTFANPIVASAPGAELQGGTTLEPPNEHHVPGGGGGGYWGGASGGVSVNHGHDAAGGGGSGFCSPLMASCTTTAAEGLLPPENDDNEYVEGVGVGGSNDSSGGNGLVVIKWIGNFVDLDIGGDNTQCLLEPGTVTVIDPLEQIHGDTCTIEVCDKSGNCNSCTSPELKYDDTDVCTAGTGLGKSADGVCGPCDADDDDCHCIKGDTSRCRDGGPVNCYTNPFHDRCPGFQNPACLIDPFTPGCPVVNPCYPTPVYDGLNCPLDAVRFCARNPYHYGCNLACADGGMACDPVPPTGN